MLKRQLVLLKTHSCRETHDLVTIYGALMGRLTKGVVAIQTQSQCCFTHIHSSTYMYLELMLLVELRAEERTDLLRLDPGDGGGGRLA